MDVDEFIWNGGGVLYLKGRGEGVIRVESYYESDFTQLEIPDTL
jgi:hypothetical protein